MAYLQAWSRHGGRESEMTGRRSVDSHFYHSGRRSKKSPMLLLFEPREVKCDRYPGVGLPTILGMLMLDGATVSQSCHRNLTASSTPQKQTADCNRCSLI